MFDAVYCVLLSDGWLRQWRWRCCVTAAAQPAYVSASGSVSVLVHYSSLMLCELPCARSLAAQPHLYDTDVMTHLHHHATRTQLLTECA